MNNRTNDDNADRFGSNAAPSEGEGNEQEPTDATGDDVGADLGRRHTTRNKERAGDGSVTLEGMITFFTYGSGVLILLIIGYFIYSQTGGSSGSNVEVQSGTNGTSTNDTNNSGNSGNKKDIEIKTADGATIDDVDEDKDELDLTRETDRKEIINKMDKFVGEIRGYDSFKSEHVKHLVGVQNRIETLIKHIKAVSGSGSADSDLKQEADQASKTADELIKKLINAYEGNKKVKEKINKLNYDVLWKVQGQRDDITGSNG